MTFEEIMRNLQTKFSLQNVRNEKERIAIEKILLDISQENIRWWQFNKKRKRREKLFEAVAIFGSITMSALTHMEDLRQTQVDTLEVQQKQQRMINIMKDTIEDLKD